MRTTISINDGIIPDGYEAVAFRVPVEGEYIIDNLGGLLEITIHISVSRPRLILQKTWMWPEWLDAEQVRFDGHRWLAENTYKSWFVLWEMTNHLEPPDRGRVYHNPRKAGGK